MLKFYTAHHSYKGDDRIDITVKGQHPIGKIFAPTWDMVMGLKEERITWLEYCEKYADLMVKSLEEKPVEWISVIKYAKHPMTFVCFCKELKACHRWLLAGILQQRGAEYLGEREL